MSWSLKIAVVAVVLMASQDLAAASTPNAKRCAEHIEAIKSSPHDTVFDVQHCSSRFGKFDLQEHLVHNLINEHIGQSFLYSIMSSHFSTDSVNRLGFSKLMDGLSDTMWTDAIELIKYIGTRGGGIAPLDDPARKDTSGLRVAQIQTVGPWSELDALASALDHHHIIANQVHDLHARSKDAALAGYLEQQFTGKHANKIRELSGLLTNLVPMYKESAGRDLAHYLFDQKLLA